MAIGLLPKNLFCYFFYRKYSLHTVHAFLPIAEKSRMAESGAVLAEDLFAASLAADSDRWLAFHIDPTQPTQQLGQDLLHWLDQNKPSVVTR